MISYPLVVTDVEGGPYEFNSFVAGMMLGAVDENMKIWGDRDAVEIVADRSALGLLVDAFKSWVVEVQHLEDNRILFRATPPRAVSVACPPAVVRQVDLAAMSRGWAITRQVPVGDDDSEPEGWLRLTIERTRDELTALVGEPS